ncbi:MAG: hypothetical protein KDB14_19865 [Planctomycetales bacterium]|nr:hypothetical protein [Planctomycetales bacterium]
MNSTRFRIRALIGALIRDERGMVASSELVMLVTLLAIGLIVAAKSFRDSAVTEFADFAQAIGNFDQSYNVPDILIDDMGTPDPADDVILVGSGFADARDYCDVSAADPPTSSNTNVWAVPNKFANPIQFVPANGE